MRNALISREEVCSDSHNGQQARRKASPDFESIDVDVILNVFKGSAEAIQFGAQHLQTLLEVHHSPSLSRAGRMNW